MSRAPAVPPPSSPLTPPIPTAPPTRPTQPLATGGDRLIGPDVVRALALIGVVLMNFHGYLINMGGENSTNFWGRVFNPWTGPLGTRFAATFVLVAGVGVTLFTRRSIGNPEAVAAKRWTLMRRGLLLYGFGLVFYEIWAGSILPYYGAMFFLAAFLFTLPTVAIGAVGVASALIGAGIHWWGVERTWDGRPPTWLYSPGHGSPRGLLFNVFVNGTHPLFPWLAFFCAGLILGRVLRTQWWQPVCIIGGIMLFGVARLLSDALTQDTAGPLSQALWTDDPFDRGLLYTASALGTSLAAFGVIYAIATAFSQTAIVQIFAHAGQMSLTLYVLHALVFNFVVRWMGWIEPAGLDLALTFALVYWVLAIAAGSLWHRRFGIGPVEWLYRKLSA